VSSNLFAILVVVGAKPQGLKRTLGQTVACQPCRSVVDVAVENELLEHHTKVAWQVELHGELTQVLSECSFVFRPQHPQLQDASPRAAAPPNTELVTDQPLQLREPLLASHQVRREASPHVLPEQRGARLQANEAEYATQDVVGGAASCLGQVPLESGEQVSFARAGGAVNLERVWDRASRRFDPGTARFESSGVDLADIDEVLPGVLNDVLAKWVGKGRKLAHCPLLGAMPT
jgi:hypothetical protein